MDFLSNIANSTPGVGTVKALYHYARGEEEKGNEAMYQSTRTTAVIAGGIFGGPAGAIGAGLATDAATSALMGEEKGLINSFKDIGEDIESNRNPTRSIASAGLQLGLDGITGYGGSSSGVSNASSRAFGKSIQRGGEQVIQKSVRISSAEAAKMVARKSTERAAKKVVERTFVVTAHVGLSAAQRTDLEERERREKEWEERERERRKRERKQRERESKEREWRERESREREWRESRVREWRESREREWRERQQRREREQQNSKKQEECKKNEQQANSEKQTRVTSGLSAGSSQPPKDNKDNNKECKEKSEASFFETFMTILERILKIIYGNESEPFSSIFKNLSKEQRKYLLKVLKPIRASGTLEVAIALVIRFFKQHLHRDISFLNFLSLLEFVQTYITDELLERTLISSGTETEETKMKPKKRREKIISEIVSEKDIIEKLRILFEGLKTEITAEIATWNSIFPNFRDIFAAVYHYFKHRRLPADGRILSVKEYYYWIRKSLEELKSTHKYTELKKAKVRSYVSETFQPIFRRRFRIVLTLHDDEIVLSTAFVVTMMCPDDKEKHAILIVSDILTVVFLSLTLLFILKNVFFYGIMLLLNTPRIVFNCIAFIVTFLLNTLLFFCGCLIFILKVLLNILLIYIFFWFLYFLSS